MSQALVEKTPAPTPKPKKKTEFKRGDGPPLPNPERAFLTALIGKPVVVHLAEPIGNVRRIDAILAYVDRYTLGFRLPPHLAPKGQTGNPTPNSVGFVVWKAMLVGLEPADGGLIDVPNTKGR